MNTKSESYQVVLDRCESYDHFLSEEYLESYFSYFSHLSNFRSLRVLLKPNLVSSRAPAHGCTDARFIRAVAMFFKNKGAEVVLGDSPAFGSAYSVCKSKNIVESLSGLDVQIVEFDERVPIKLGCGIKVDMARSALECDLLVNLPKVKAHSQMYMTLAVKNCFGLVTGVQKALLHMKHGTGYQLFSELITDIQVSLPNQIVIGDGIEGMHVTGPIKGEKINMGLVACADNPFAFDAAIFETLRLKPERSPLLKEALKREIVASNPQCIHYPLLAPFDFKGIEFITPDSLIPIRFNPFRFVKGLARRLLLKKNY